MTGVVQHGDCELYDFVRLVESFYSLGTGKYIKIPKLFFLQIEDIDMLHALSLLFEVKLLLAEKQALLLLACGRSCKPSIHRSIDRPNSHAIKECLRLNLIALSALMSIYVYVTSSCPYPAPMWNLVMKIKGPSLLNLARFIVFWTDLDYPPEESK